MRVRKAGTIRHEPNGSRKKKAAIFEIWREKVLNREITWAKVGRDLGLDYKWLCDFVNDAVIADQVYKVKLLDRYFKTEDLDVEKYRSEKIEPVEEGERLL